MKNSRKKIALAQIIGTVLVAGILAGSKEYNRKIQPEHVASEHVFHEYSVKTDEEMVKACSLGPGYRTLPYLDTYANYQWAFLNLGIFKLVPNSVNGGNGAQEHSSQDSFAVWQDGPAQDVEETTVSTKGIDINVLPAWKKYSEKADKRQVVVALIDTGVDITHEDLADSIWVNKGEIANDGIDNDGNGYIDDVYGWNFYSGNNQIYTGNDDNHGTHSAGTIAAAKNDKGVLGIADPEYVKVMVIKVLGTATGVGTPESVVKAIQYAEANGASICNLSFGTEKYSQELYETMKNSNMLFVVAAGNGDKSGKGYDIDSRPVYPASFELDNIISVASMRMDGKLDSASNYGRMSVDLAAPGHYILSTIVENGYGYMTGTSMATPMVSGTAAMLYSYEPQISLSEVKHRIVNSVRKMGSLNGKTASGGMLDVYAALGGTTN